MGRVSSPNWGVFIPLGGGGVQISLLAYSALVLIDTTSITRPT